MSDGGLAEESWSLDYQVFWGDPAGPEVWRQLDGFLMRRFRHRRAIADLPIAAVAIDTGGHRTSEVMKYAQARQNRRVWAIKGRGGSGVPAWPKRPPKPKRNALAPLFIVGVDGIKHTLLARLRASDPGPGCCHFPQGRDRDWFAGLTAERPVRKWTKGVARIEWVPDPGVRNEPLDCRVYAIAALQGLIATGIRPDDAARAIREAPARKMEAATESRAAPAGGVIKSRWLS